MRARRVDKNLDEIVKAARKLGYRVFVNNNELCDLVVQVRIRGVITTELWEVKNVHGKNRATPGQLALAAQGWQIRTVRSVEDILGNYILDSHSGISGL